MDYYDRPFTLWSYGSRLRIAADLLGQGPYDSLLEVGYGSGIFLPELARRTRRLSAIVGGPWPGIAGGGQSQALSVALALPLAAYGVCRARATDSGERRPAGGGADEEEDRRQYRHPRETREDDA